MVAIANEKAIEIKHNFAILGKDVFAKYTQYLSDDITTEEFMRFVGKRWDETQRVNELARKYD